MTFVCAWRHETFGYPCISVVADSLITTETKAAGVRPLSKYAVKIMKVGVRYFGRSNLTPEMDAPRFEFDIGIAYCGHCLEALYIIELARRYFEFLYHDAAVCTPVSLVDLAKLLEKIAREYFSKHGGTERRDANFFVFGHCPAADELTLLRVTSSNQAATETMKMDLTEPFHWIGQTTAGYYGEVADLLEKIGARYSRLMERRADTYEPDLIVAKEALARMQVIIGNTEHQLGDDGPQAVGGTTQIAETYLRKGKPVVAITDSVQGLLGASPRHNDWQFLLPKDSQYRRQ